VARLFELCLTHRPDFAVMADVAAAADLEARLRARGSAVQVRAGEAELEAVAALREADCVVAAIVGAAGLRSALAAARAGKRVLLANKEALVITGKLFMDEVRRSGAELLPIDSEHNAVFQCLPRDFERGLDRAGVRAIWLTASGGPFRTTALSDLHRVTPQQACAHPNWVMGRKISVDSATMMNKGLEVIEACWLFDAEPERVRVVLHPQSVIHSLVEYVDGSFLAQLGYPDMRVPLAHALAWPERIDSGAPALDLMQVAQLGFEPLDLARYPCLRLACQAMEIGGTASAILSAANEVAVHAFLDGQLAFTGIPHVIEATLSQCPPHEAADLEVILADDAAARDAAARQVAILSERIGNG
jgi:1-deoxy-D-xylulose-5-phosphate reductoisomerase